MSAPEPQKVAIITGASQGIGAGLVDGLRRSGYALVGTARSILRSDEPDYLTVEGDIAQAETADHVVERPLAPTRPSRRGSSRCPMGPTARCTTKVTSIDLQ
jgi:NAD(P)-dependent dehydrogenase (short-subunit alcohol dehydrogenase family)